jgi:hypothetical protein
MEFFALPARMSCPESTGRARMKTQKAASSPLRKTAASGVYETSTPNSIDMLRDGTSFPESCGGRRDIGGLLESVK